MTGSDHEQELFSITPDTFNDHFAGRPIRRLGFERFQRNLMVALWSVGRNDEALQIAQRPWANELHTAQAREPNSNSLIPTQEHLMKCF